MKYLAFLVSAFAVSLAASSQAYADYSLEKRLLSDLGQFNAMEAIP